MTPPQAFAERLPSWSKTFSEAYYGSGFDALVRVLMYIIEVVDGATLDHLKWVDREVDAPEGEVTMTLAEKLRQEGEQRGLEKGLKQGHDQGQRALLLKLLKTRFDGLTIVEESRVQKASRDELEKMAERILTARTLADVFNDDN